MPNTLDVRNRALHDALREFALDAAALLSGDLDAGAELPFELEEEPGGASVLYRYRPLTAEFIATRWARLRTLESRERAQRALGAGAESYLRTRGATRADPEPALQAMLERLWEEASNFAFPEERFESVYGEVERTLHEAVMQAEVLAPLAGARMADERVDLGSGLSMRRGQGLEAPVEALWPHGLERPGGAPSVVCVLERESNPDGALPLEEARVGFARLGTAVRLWSSGVCSLGPQAWARVNGGPWRSFPLPPQGPGRGEPWSLGPGEGEELAALFDAVSHSRHAGSVAWALKRFELGCQRSSDAEALSDHLLALEALLDGGGDLGRAPMSLRLAALCAEERDRRTVQRRIELALSLERFFMNGGSEEAYLEEIGSESPHALVLETEEHLRALLRDVLCGYLDAHLRSTADDVLLRSAEPLEIRARDLRDREDRVAVPMPTASGRWLEEAGADGVTPCEEWTVEEEAASYSAPV